MELAPWQVAVCEEAKTWEDTPYVPKGRVKGVGVDCGGILYQIYNPLFGPFATMPDDYPPDWSLHQKRERYLDFIMPYVDEVPNIVVGGFCLIHLGQAYSHAAIMLDDGNYIHAWGRLRQGRVTRTNPRLIHALARQGGRPLKYFQPKGV
jgi:cell wall-associated NlpC family hydrolase